MSNQEIVSTTNNMKSTFCNRVYGCIIVKSINSNFNADFTGQPRTLPDGVVYSTDKALKYTIKQYFLDFYKSEKVFLTKRYNENLNPLTLDETYDELFSDKSHQEDKGKKKNKEDGKEIKVLSNLLQCLDIRFFGVTFASKKYTNVSIHGPLQINHGVNKFLENDIYSEDILSPFRNPGKSGDDKKSNKDKKEIEEIEQNEEQTTEDEKSMTTIGNQTNLKEGHYVFHFSINPKNIEEYIDLLKEAGHNPANFKLTDADIEKFKEAMNRSVTYVDSSRKIGSENEVAIYIKLTETSKKVIPSLTDLIYVVRDKSTVKIDCKKVKSIIDSLGAECELVEVYYNPDAGVIIEGFEEGTGKIKKFNIINGVSIR